MATTTTTIRGFPRPLARAMEAYASRLDLDSIREAYDLAAEAHSGQRRASGEPYINHAVEVATIVASLQLETASVVSALVHDVVEDTVVSLQEIREILGEEVASIVDGVTKIGQVPFGTRTERQVENYRKLLLSMAKNPRVIFVKLADRLHNMRTLEHLPRGKQKPIARETREIYAPLAHRLGMAAIKSELEDLAFKFLDRRAYDELRRLVRQRHRARERNIQKMRRPLEDALAAEGIPAQVTGRPKHLWSIHHKMVTQDRSYDDIHDLMGLRVITDSVDNCYSALGVIDKLGWKQIPGCYDNYVATPKSNNYRSIHTTVYGPGGRRYELQIRTEEMHEEAEFGIAAHWRYKAEGREGGANRGSSPPRTRRGDDALIEYRKRLAEWQKETLEPEEYMELLRMDLSPGEIFVFTPKGEVKRLPVDSSPIDFAFSVHSEVGLHCAGAKVNGRIAPLSRQLKSGDSVEIITNPRQWPNRDWLGFVKTSRARHRIRQWDRREKYDRALRHGRKLFRRELRKTRRPKPSREEMADGARRLGRKTFDDVLAALAQGDVDPSAVIRSLYPDEDPSDVVKRSPSALERIAEKIRKSNRGVTIGGVDNLMWHSSQCCQPVPGDKAIGYLTRGRGMSVHRTDCPNVLNLDPARRKEIQWKVERDDRFFVHLRMEGTDRRGLLGDVARTITETATDIQHADMRATDGGMTAAFVVEVQDLSHLERVMQAVQRVKGVLTVIRRERFSESDLLGGGGS